MGKKPFLQTTIAFLDGKNYLVEDFPWDKVEAEGPAALKRAVAYRYETMFTKGLYPYRGIIDEDFSWNTAAVGIWFMPWRHGQFRLKIVRPRTKKEFEEYRLGKEQNLQAAVMNCDYTVDQFTDTDAGAADLGVDVYMPPIHDDDDWLAKAIKLAIWKKHAPFEPYGKRMEALAVDRSRTTEGNNIKGNTKRRHRVNRQMTPAKAQQDSDTWQLEPVVLLRDAPGAMHRMDIPENTLLAMFPSGMPFNIKDYNILDMSAMLAEAISETTDDEDYLGSRKKNDEAKET